VILAALALAGCGGAGDSESKACSLCGTMNDLRGSISSKTGSQAEMAAWVVAAFERDSGIARVSDIDSAGLYTLAHVRTDHPQTLALFTPEYILQGVLSVPDDNNNKIIHQFVQFTGAQVPKLISNGPIITFQSLDNMKVTKDVAADANSDGIPDGGKTIGAAALTGMALTGLAPDTDLDGIGNDKDPDVNGDGIINWLDQDDNGNGILDVFDGDQNGDLVNDSSPQGHNTDQWFKEGVEYIAVQFELTPKDDGTGNETTLKFTTKVQDDVTPIAVQIRGAPTLLNAATYTAKDAQGNDTTNTWNRQLMDDGVSEDGNPGDRVFAKKVTLANAAMPRAHETVFFELVFGSKAAPWYIDFPYTFPDLRPAAITSLYDANTRTVRLVGAPFGSIKDFIWIINLLNSSGSTVWTSQAVSGITDQFVIPENFIQAGQTYKYEVIAQTLDKIPGFPSYAIHTPKYDLR